MGNKIGEIRKLHGYTQQQLSKELNIPRSTLAMYETNRVEPNFSTLIEISQIFNVSIDYLLGLSTSKESYERIGLQIEPFTITFIDENKRVYIYKVDKSLFKSFQNIVVKNAINTTIYETQPKKDDN